MDSSEGSGSPFATKVDVEGSEQTPELDPSSLYLQSHDKLGTMCELGRLQKSVRFEGDQDSAVNTSSGERKSEEIERSLSNFTDPDIFGSRLGTEKIKSVIFS